jgi:hypothetical protein
VAYSNADAIRGQWSAVHAVDAAPVGTRLAGGHRKQVWKDAAGGDAIELFTLAGMAHGTPLDVPVGTEHAGQFMLDAGLSSTRIAAQAWGLTLSFERWLDAVGKDAGRSKKQPPLPPSSSGIQKIIEDAPRPLA